MVQSQQNIFIQFKFDVGGGNILKNMKNDIYKKYNLGAVFVTRKESDRQVHDFVFASLF
jgi:hypothetical protein